MCVVMQRLIVFLLVARGFSFPLEKNDAAPTSIVNDRREVVKERSPIGNHDSVITIQDESEFVPQIELKSDGNILENVGKIEGDGHLKSSANLQGESALNRSEAGFNVEQKPVLVNAEVGKITFSDSIKGVKVIPKSDVKLLDEYEVNNPQENSFANTGLIISEPEKGDSIHELKNEEKLAKKNTKVEVGQESSATGSKIIFEDEPSSVNAPEDETFFETTDVTEPLSEVDTKYSSIENHAPISLDDLLHIEEQEANPSEIPVADDEIFVVSSDNQESPSVEEGNDGNLPSETNSDVLLEIPSLSTEIIKEVPEETVLKFNENNADLPISNGKDDIQIENIPSPSIIENEASDYVPSTFIDTGDQESEEVLVIVAPDQENVDLFNINEPIQAEIENKPIDELISDVTFTNDFSNSPDILIGVIEEYPNDVKILQNENEPSTILKSEANENEVLVPLVEHIPQILPIEPIAEIETEIHSLEPIIEEQPFFEEESPILSIKPIAINRISMTPVEPIAGENSDIFSIKPIAGERPNTFSKKPIVKENPNTFPIEPVAIENPNTMPITPLEVGKSPSLLESLANAMKDNIGTGSLINDSEEKLIPLGYEEQIPSFTDHTITSNESDSPLSIEPVKNSLKKDKIPSSNSDKNSFDANSFSDLLSSIYANSQAFHTNENPSLGVFIDTKKVSPMESNLREEQYNNNNPFTSFPFKQYGSSMSFNPFGFYPSIFRRNKRPQMTYQDEEQVELEKTKIENDNKNTNEGQTSIFDPINYSTGLFKTLIKSLKGISDMTVKNNEAPVTPTKINEGTPVIIILNIPQEKLNEENDSKLKPKPVDSTTKNTLKNEIPEKERHPPYSVPGQGIPNEQRPPFYKPNKFYPKFQHNKFRPSFPPSGYNHNSDPYNYLRHLQKYYDTNRFPESSSRNIPKNYYKFSYMPRMGHPYFNKRNFRPSKPVVFPNRHYY